MPTDTIIINADGACLGNPGVGGWGFTKTLGEATKEYSGHVAAATTNNQMELFACAQAVKSLTRRDLPAIVRTDSKYVVDNFNRYLPRWLANGWVGYGGKPVKNQELWRALKAAVDAHTAGVTFVWIKGHCGDAGNERADKLAAAAAARAAKLVGANCQMPSRFDPESGLIVPLFSDESAAA